MTYEEIEVGQKVFINVKPKKYQGNGVVAGKEVQTVKGRPIENIYVDDERRGRRVCAPSVLEPLA
jgi:hypothetical protein